MQTYRDMDLLGKVTKTLYPKIALEFQTTPPEWSVVYGMQSKWPGIAEMHM